ncbi:hypothetical protein F4X88_12480 [Candidatus Poribacteria bacterium]|nr:hypothetical protein [Candidatus Poribacteria bacterium]
MNETWISQQELGILMMVIFIPLGPIVGTLGWLFVPKGKAKKLTLGVLAFGCVMGFVLLVFGIIAYFFGQPRWVWLRSIFFGLNDTVLFAFVYWVILKRYREAELRKSMSEDLTFGGNKTQDINNRKEKEEF